MIKKAIFNAQIVLDLEKLHTVYLGHRAMHATTLMSRHQVSAIPYTAMDFETVTKQVAVIKVTHMCLVWYSTLGQSRVSKLVILWQWNFLKNLQFKNIKRYILKSRTLMLKEIILACGLDFSLEPSSSLSGGLIESHSSKLNNFSA